MTKIIIAGGSGFLGQSLARRLGLAGHEVVILSRRGAPSDSARPGNVRFVQWDGATLGPWAAELNGAHAVVNLTGKSVDCRYTEDAKREIIASRVNSVRVLQAALSECQRPPQVFVQAASTAIYGDRGSETCDETSPPGVGFSPDVCQRWEAAAGALRGGSLRLVVLRISFVLGREGGALQKLTRLTRCFLGGSVGNGQQCITWLHQDDMNAIFERALFDDSLDGTYNAASPNPVTNRDFMTTLRRTLGMPWSPRTPALLVRLGARLMGTEAELALTGRRAPPVRLRSAGFAFAYPYLDDALAAVYGVTPGAPLPPPSGLFWLVTVPIAAAITAYCVGAGNIGAAMVLGVPFALGVTLGVAGQGRVTLRVFAAIGALAAIIVTLATLSLVGPYCALLGMVLTGLPLMIGLVVGYLWRSRRRLQRGRQLAVHLLPILLLPPATAALEHAFGGEPEVETVTTSAVLALPVANAWHNLRFFEQTTGEPPLVVRLGLPKPLGVLGAHANVGDLTTCVYSRGHLLKQVTRVEPESHLGFRVLEQQGVEDRSVRLLDGSFDFQAQTPRAARVTLTTRYEPLLSPRWYWRPVEHWTAHSLHNHILQEMTHGPLPAPQYTPDPPPSADPLEGATARRAPAR